MTVRSVTRAVVLARVSTKKRSQDTSGPRQLAQLREEAKQRKWIVVGAFTDRLSGGEQNRPGLTEALALIRTRKASVLMVHDLDRLGRDTRDLLTTLDVVRAWGGDLFIRDASVDTTAEGRLGFTIIAALAEYQRRSNSRKVIAGLAHARKKGIRLGRPPALPASALARAVELRQRGGRSPAWGGLRRRPPLSWSLIVGALQKEKHGSFAKGTLAGAVTRSMRRPPAVRRRA